MMLMGQFDTGLDYNVDAGMIEQHTTMCKVMLMERKCTDKAARMRSALQRQLSAGTSGSGSDAWDRTVSFFTVKKALIFHNGYSKSTREALRAFPSPADDVAPLCCQ
ncbi:uncharacterized protein LOC144013204 [Festucalex cinctus]